MPVHVLEEIENYKTKTHAGLNLKDTLIFSFKKLSGTLQSSLIQI